MAPNRCADFFLIVKLGQAFAWPSPLRSGSEVLLLAQSLPPRSGSIIIRSQSRKARCRCANSSFVIPSAGIKVVSTYSTLRSPAWYLLRSQHCCISTCLILVSSFWPCVVTTRIVCLLLYNNLPLLLRLKSMFLNTRSYQIISVLAQLSAYSSNSVDDLVTIVCFVDFQSIIPLNKKKTIPSKLLRVSRSSANNASKAPKNSSSCDRQVSLLSSLLY